MLKKSLLGAAMAVTACLPALHAAEPEIWFCPLDSVMRQGPGYTPVTQFMDLFKPDAPWKEAAGHVKVFKIYQTWAMEAPESELKTAFADLKRRGIALALEVDVMTPRNEVDKHSAGFGPEPLLKMVRRIEENGGDLKYIAMDEPICLSVAQPPTPVRMQIDEIAENACKNIKEMLAVYPHVEIGDIEPVGPSDIKDTAKFVEGWKAFARNGVPLKFFVADLDWYKPGVLTYVREIRDAAHKEGMRFGIIYDGDPQDGSDAAWLKSTQKRVLEGEAALGTGSADFITFQTWHPWPKKLLPEQDADAFTHVINAYFRTRTSLLVAANGKTVTGRLLTAKGQPIAGATVQISEETTARAGVMGTQTATGVVPEGCYGVCFGVWANETGWPGTDSLHIRQIKLETQNGWSTTKTFPGGMPLPDWPGLEGRVSQTGDTLDLAPTVGQPVMFNSQRVPVDARGQKFTFTVQAQIPPAAADTGCVGVFFLRQTPDELWRELVPFRPATTLPGTAVTNADGTWSFQLPDVKRDVKINAAYSGDEKYRPAQGSNLRAAR